MILFLALTCRRFCSTLCILQNAGACTLVYVLKGCHSQTQSTQSLEVLCYTKADSWYHKVVLRKDNTKYAFPQKQFDVINLNIARVLYCLVGNQWNEGNGGEGHPIFSELGPMPISSSFAFIHQVEPHFWNFQVTCSFPVVLTKRPNSQVAKQAVFCVECSHLRQ